MKPLSGPALHIPLAVIVVASGVGIGVLLQRAAADADSQSRGNPSERVVTLPPPAGQTWFMVVSTRSPATQGSTTFGAHAPDGAAPEPLTPEECLRAKSIIKVTGENFRKFIASQPDAGAIRNGFEAEQQAAEAWAAAGCPPDPVRGKYPAANGSSPQIRPYATMSFSGDGPGESYLVITGP